MDVVPGSEVDPPGSPLYRSIPLAVVGLLCFVGAELAALSLTNLGGATVAPVWLASGVLTGALILAPRDRWPAVCAVAWIAMALPLAIHGHSLPGAAGLAAVYAAEGALAARLVARHAPGPFDLSRPAHLFALAGVSVVVPLFTGLVVALVEVAGQSASLRDVWLVSWFANTLGLFLTAVPVLGWMEWRAAPAASRRGPLELSVMLVLVAGLSEGIYGDVFPDVVRAPTYVLPFILWAVFRLGPGGTAVGMLTVVSVGLWNTTRATGPFALFTLSPEFILLRAQGAAILTGGSLTLLAGMLAERRRLFDQLERAVVEIRTLRGFIPICAWCHKVRDDAGFWHGIERYLNSHTGAVFSHSICPACNEEQQHDLSAHRDAGRRAHAAGDDG